MRYFQQPKTILITLTLICMCFATSCGVDRYNAVTEKTKDLREKDARIYGDGKDQPARQTKQTYPDPAEGAARTEAIREKFYGKTGETAPAPVVKVDTTAKKTEEKKKV